MKYYIEIFGCQMNNSDSALIAGTLQQAGHHEAENINDAQIIIVNTCCVRQSAENRILGFLGNLKHHKQAIIVACGCMVQKTGTVEKLSKSYSHIDIILGTFSLAKLPAYIEEYLARGKKIIDIEERYDLGDLSQVHAEIGDMVQSRDKYRAQISIIYGCDNFCSYCIVPYVRGRERSRAPRLVLNDVQQAVDNGAKEIQLLGQNVNSYGRDLSEGWDFAALLQEVNKIEGIERIRYMTSHPRDFNSRLLDIIAQSDKVCRHFHLPLQSGCDKILDLMNRGYKRADYLHLIEEIRGAFPFCSITTDLIVGFPGETEADFAETLDFMSQLRLDAAYTFIYSVRSGTPAAKMKGQVSAAEKKSRLQRLMNLQNPISLQHNQKLVGKTMPIMIEGTSKNNHNMLSGRSDCNKIVLCPMPKDEILNPGNIVDMVITEAKTWTLYGEIGKSGI